MVDKSQNATYHSPPVPLLLPLTSLIDNAIGIRELALANGGPCSVSANTIETPAAGAAPAVVLMNDGERQIGCRYALLTDWCVDKQRLLDVSMSHQCVEWNGFIS